MEFWDGERCEYCNGLIVEKRGDLTRKVGEKYVLIENVPAGVCTECGTRYYAANVEGYAIWCPGLPGCWSQGATEEEALENIKDAIEMYLAAVNDLG